MNKKSLMNIVSEIILEVYSKSASLIGGSYILYTTKKTIRCQTEIA